MSDDIVARLRYQRTNSVLCVEAANEIERLRAENTDLRGTLVKMETTGVRLWQMVSSSRDSYADEVMVLRDEIERLRAEVAYLKQGWYPTPATVQSFRWWKRAVSGE